MTTRPRAQGRTRGAITAALVLAAGLLTVGCAETKLAATAAKSVTGDSTAPPGRGIYKIGDPYQIGGIWYYPAEDYRYDETGIASWYGPDFHGKYTANGEIYDMNDLTAAHHTLPLPSLVRVTNLDNGRSIVVRVNDRGPFARGRILDMSRRSAQLLGFELTGTAKVRVQILADESRQLAAQMKTQGTQLAAAARPYRVDVQPGETAPVNAPRVAVTSTPLAPPSGAPAPTQVAQAALPPAVSTAALPPASATAAVAMTPLGAPPGPLVPPSVAAKTPALVQVKSQLVTQGAVKKGSQIYVQAGAFSNANNAQRLSSQLRSVGPTKVVPVKISNQQLFRVRVGPLASVEAGDRALDQVVAAGHPEARIVVD
jgi:rare lipoprotein A